MSEIDPQIIDQINKEGFEGNEEGGATLIIGKKGGELDRLKQRVEKRNQYVDVATYVRLNKTIAVPNENVPEDLKKQIGRGWVTPSVVGSENLTYIDKEGNVAKVNFVFSQIASINSENQWVDPVSQLKQELSMIGFKRVEEGYQVE